MKTYEQRKAETLAVLTDPDIERTVMEGLAFVYHWYRYERAVILRRKFDRQVKKYANLANNDHDVFMLRKDMKHL